MTPKVFTDLITACNDCILSCENLIKAADLCTKTCENKQSCSQGAQGFLEKSKHCIVACEVCIKKCDAMIAVFKDEGHEEHMEALNTCVKELGENIRIINESVDQCSLASSCKVACAEAKESCNRAIQAADECIESCEKHEVFFDHIKKY